jgi:hypothetical protein
MIYRQPQQRFTGSYPKLLALIILSFATLCLAARALGQAQPANPALTGFVQGCEGVPMPCWYGIVPEQTTVQEAADILRRAGFQLHYAGQHLEAKPTAASACEFDLPFDTGSEVIHLFNVRKCGLLQLGDLLTLLGAPNVAYSCVYYAANREMPILNLQYKGTYLFQRVTNTARFDTLALPDAYQKIDAVSFSGLVLNPGIKWRGFVAYWRFQQLEPDKFDMC